MVLHHTHHHTFVFDGVETNRLTLFPKQAAAFSAGVQGEEHILIQRSLYNLAEQKNYHPLHNWLDLKEISITNSSNDIQTFLKTVLRLL